MAQSPDRKRPTRTSSVLLVAPGAVAGVALGILVADRLGGVNGLRRRGGRGSRREPGPEGWRNDEGRTEAFDERADDDSERSGESNAHRHVRPRGEHQDSTPNAMPDPVLEARAIDIGAVGSGAIELTGWVESTGEIAHALILARGLPGVTAVVDHLAVRGPGAIQIRRTAQHETPHWR